MKKHIAEHEMKIISADKIKTVVTASKWHDDEGFLYTTDVDPMEIDDLGELHDAAQEYAAIVADETQLADNEDLQLDFYLPDVEEPAASLWVKESAALAH